MTALGFCSCEDDKSRGPYYINCNVIEHVGCAVSLGICIMLRCFEGTCDFFASQIWNVSTGTEVAHIMHTATQMHDITFLPDGQGIITLCTNSIEVRRGEGKG